ncbi:cation:proton antiporter [Christensenella intestinihominis]|uniref:cation:proton antiporter n=1 Tax=Christensenella intestinihominis TaxID=1851429 RepID=UPI000829DA79|nr:cation:proton antiporter [Christensenella intestinihominis]
MDYKYLLDLALILLSTKLLGLVTRKFKMPQVVGALLAGIILGPACLGIIDNTNFIKALSEIGVIVLMFSAGMESDIHQLKKAGKASFIIAALGVAVPLVVGFAVAGVFNNPSVIQTDLDTNRFLQNVFIGVILTATSVSITVETLKEMGKLNSQVGITILGAAVIDDILGIIALTVITSLADPSVAVGIVLLKIVGFFAFAIGVGFVTYLAFKKWSDRHIDDHRRFVVMAFVICLLMSFCAEEWFGVADITGAFIAGLILSNTSHAKYMASRFETLSYTLLSPIFFASVGLSVVLTDMSMMIVIFALVLLGVAIITKIVGCGLGAKIAGFNNKESMQIGCGMVSRGEVALIVANKGAAVGLMSPILFGPVVIVVVVTTILSPILLKLSFGKKKKKGGGAGIEDPVLSPPKPAGEAQSQ